MHVLCHDIQNSYIHLYTYMHACVCTHIYGDMCLYMQVHACTCYVHACMCAYVPGLKVGWMTWMI